MLEPASGQGLALVYLIRANELRRTMCLVFTCRFVADLPIEPLHFLQEDLTAHDLSNECVIEADMRDTHLDARLIVID